MEANYLSQIKDLSDKDIAVFDKIGAIPQKTIHADAHIFVACLKGKAACKIDNKVYEINKNDIIIGHPNQFFENEMVSCDFECRGMILSPSYFQNIFALAGNFWKAGLNLFKMPVIHLDETEMHGFVLNHEMLKYKMQLKDLPHHQQSINLLLQSLLYEFCDMLAPKLKVDLDSYQYSSSEIIFKRFANLMAEEAPVKHEVAYFAGKLCITPKYLSFICKQQTQKTASELINNVTLGYIKQMLQHSDMSIKEIATKTGFSNLSFFGKYVRRELGMSPREYRLHKDAE